LWIGARWRRDLKDKMMIGLSLSSVISTKSQAGKNMLREAGKR
jgi:hypothetical protein